MFLVFGITSGTSDLGLRKCKFFSCCGKSSAMAAVSCTFNQFTLFFIPILKFRKRYFVSCPACGTVYEILNSEGKRIEKDYYSEINPDKMYAVQQSSAKVCPKCKYTVNPNTRYCPNCGTKLF